MKYEISEDALVKSLDDGAVALNTATGSYFSLNETAALTCAMIENGSTEEEIVAALVDRYEVSREMAQSDLARLLLDLLEHGIIT
jgi:PqqD family protein of HPr-rel-A system